MIRHANRLSLLALLLAQAGCSLFGDECEGFNPYVEYERLKRPDDDEAQKEKVPPGVFRLACYNLKGDEKLIEQAIAEALRDSGGGSVSQLSQADAESNMLDYSRGSGGPYSAQKPRIGRYEVTFRSRDIPSEGIPPMNVTWRGTKDTPRQFKVNEPGSPVALLDLGEEQFRLIFSPEANLRCEGPDLLSAGKGKYRFRRPLFELTLAAGDRKVEAEIMADKEVAEVKEPPVNLYEVTGFSGNVSEFLCKLLRENRILDRNNTDEAPWIAEFRMRETTIWLDAQVGRGAGEREIRATWTQAANGPARELQVDVPGLGQFQEGEDAQRGYSLKGSYNEDNDEVTIEFSLKLGDDAEMQEEFVTFKFTVDGAPRTERVRIRQP